VPAKTLHFIDDHPFTVAEVTGSKLVPDVLKEIPIRSPNNLEIFLSLDKFGGFPEPFLKQSTRGLQRWYSEKVDRLFREDIRDMESIVSPMV